jgi:hypothetical protein
LLRLALKGKEWSETDSGEQEDLKYADASKFRQRRLVWACC